MRKYGRAADSQERYDRFLRWFTAWGGIRYFSDVTDHGVLAMDAALREKGMTDYSKWNNYHRFLNSFIIDAMDAGLLRRNPYKWLNIERDKESKSLHKYLTLEELRRVETARMGTESLERVLGHSSTKVPRTTYARLLDDTVVREMLEAEREIGIKKDGKA